MTAASIGAFVLAVLRALPALIALISAIRKSADAKVNQGIGYDQAVADALKETADKVTIAHQVELEADKAHEKSDDSAFDQDFRRS